MSKKLLDAILLGDQLCYVNTMMVKNWDRVISYCTKTKILQKKNQCRSCATRGNDCSSEICW